MNIYSKHGDKIIFDHPNYGWENDQKIAKDHLVIGEIYTVDRISIDRSQSKVFLIEVDGIPFNTVLFSNITKATYEEVKEKLENLYWRDKKFVFSKHVEYEEFINKWEKLKKEFEEYMSKNGWSFEEFIDEQFKRLKISEDE